MGEPAQLLRVLSSSFPQKSEHGCLFGVQVVERGGRLLFGLLAGLRDCTSVQIGLNDRRVDVRLAADCRSVAQPFGYLLDGLYNVLPRLRLCAKTLRLAQRYRGQHCARPGAEILGSEVFT